jgi:type IV secretory pathway VirB2 component (pilin)
MNTSDVSAAAARAGDSKVVEWGARLGYAVVGLLHLVIAWIALKVAWGIGGGSKDADTSGALSTIGSSGTGPLLLWVAVVGFVLLAVWQLAEAGIRHGETSDRLKAGGKGVLYLFFAWTTFTVIQGSSASSEQQTEDFTAGLMGGPLGRLLVGVAGLAVLGIAVYHVVKGWKRKFLRDLREHPGVWAVHAGRVGYVAKGIALVVVGFFLLVAAVQADPAKAQGLDGALKTVKDQPFGPVLLTLVAVGIAAYGFYSFARARYARV